MLKPFDYSEFLETVEKALLLTETTTPQLTEVPDYMFVKTDYKQVKVLYSDILYIESLKDYVRIYLIGDTPYHPDEFKEIRRRIAS